MPGTFSSRVPGTFSGVRSRRCRHRALRQRVDPGRIQHL